MKPNIWSSKTGRHMKAWHARMTAFQAGQWMQLLEAAGATQTQANTDQHQPSTTTGPTEERQARRPCQLVHQGQFSAARQALTASAFALGTDQTLQQLWDPVRRPTNQYPAPAETVQSTRIPWQATLCSASVALNGPWICCPCHLHSLTRGPCCP